MLTRTGLCQALGVHNRTDSSQEPLKDRHLDSLFIDRVQKSTFAKVTEPVSGRVKGGIQAARYQLLPITILTLSTYPFLSCCWLLLANEGGSRFCVRKRIGHEWRQRKVSGSSSVYIMQLLGKSFHKEQLQAEEGKAATHQFQPMASAESKPKTDMVRRGS